MNKVISIFNYKGGVGKTTIAINLARHLNYPLYEVEKDYIFSILNTKPIDFSKKINNATFKQGAIIDVNTTNKKKIIHIFRKSDVIIFPTLHDMKDIIKTVASIKLAIEKCLLKKTDFILAFNLLDTNLNSSELRFTKEVLKNIKKVLNVSFDFQKTSNTFTIKPDTENSNTLNTSIVDEIQKGTSKDENKNTKIKVVFIRKNRVWFQNSHYYNFYQNFYLKKNPRYKNNSNESSRYELHSLGEDFDISYLTNNRILEIMYQYMFYYNPIYEEKTRRFNKEFNELKKKQKISSEKMSKKYTPEQEALKKKFDETFYFLEKDTIEEINIRYVTAEKETHKKLIVNLFEYVTRDFVQYGDFKMISYDQDLFNMFMDIYKYDSITKKYKDSIKAINEEQANKKDKTEEEIEILKLLKKEEFIHYCLSKIFDLSKIRSKRKVIKDFRFLLIATGLYNNKE